MSVNTTVSISGMHCGHCIASVAEELQELEGVEEVAVELHKDGLSIATVTSKTALDPRDIGEAVAEAGYLVVANEA